MTTSPRHMHLANARMANNTSTTAAAEVTKLVRQHFDPPPAPPYRYQKVCQKTSQTLLHERPESTWQENYDRRDHHMKCGYYSLPNEPYRNIGGQFDLDPFDLVLKTISKNLDVKVWEARSRQGTATKSRRTPQRKRRQSLLPPISNEKRAKSPTKSECQLLENKKSDGGISTIKDQLYDLQKAKKYVLAGQSFENFIKHLQVTTDEIKAFIGINILMGVMQLASYRLYWSSDPFLGNTGIRSVMTENRFSKLYQYIHVNNNQTAVPRDTEGFDKLHKVRPIINMVDHTFKDHYKPKQNQTVDEAMVKYKGRFSIKQYMPGKPIKRGMKVWMRADSTSGYCHQFNVYMGKDDPNKGPKLGEKVVKLLCKDLKWKGHHIYMDRYFTSVPLFRCLERNGIYGCGTIKCTAVGLPEDITDPPRMARGESIARQNGNLVATVWQDKKKDIKANKVKSTKKNEMVLPVLPTSDPSMELPVEISDTELQSLLTPVFGKSSMISFVTNKKNLEVKTNTPTSMEKNRKDGTNIIQLQSPRINPSIIQDVPSVQKTGSANPGSSKMTMIESRKMSVYLRSTTSVMAVMDQQAAAKERKERMKRIHMEYLDAVNIVINSLCNMKTKDLKSKTPLSFDHLKQLRKDTVCIPQTPADGTMLSRLSRPTKNASIITVPSESKVGGFSGLFAKKKQSNMFEQVAMLPSKLTSNKFSQLLKPKQKEYELKLESWEDFLAVDPHTPMPERKKKRSFATGVMTLVKAVQWHKKISESTNVGSPSSAKTGTESKSPEVQNSTAKIESIARLLHNDPSKKLPAIRKTPVWQRIAAEKVDLYEEIKSDKKEKVEPEDIVSNMRTKFIHLKHKHKQETDAEVQKLERERLLIFKYKYGLFSDMSSVFDEHCLELAHARNKINDSVDIGELIKPSLWYSELKEKAIKVCGSGNDVEEIFQKMGRHSMMDGKSVHLGKAKLCLIVMSLPAHEICTVAFQTAIKFVLERIMLHDLRNFIEWLQLRKVPYNVYDSKDTRRDTLKI